jgi:hypothetical protein
MSKEKASKLDHYAERLDEWFGIEKQTLAQVQEQLRLDGCVVSLARLSSWWSRRQRVRMQEQLLAQIASGATQVREVEKQFSGNPAPELKALMGLHRVLIFKLIGEGQADPEKLELVNRMMREVQKFERLQQLAEQNKLEARKLELMEKKAAMADAAKGLLENRQLSDAERSSRMREVFGVS